MKQSEIDKEYTAVDTMIELFRNDQRARQPMLNDRSGTTSMTRRRYEGLLGTWRNGKSCDKTYYFLDHPMLT